MVYELKPVAPGQGGFGCIPGSHRPDFPALPEHEGWRKSWATDELRGADWPANVPVHRIEAQPGDCIIFSEKARAQPSETRPVCTSDCGRVHR